MVGYFIKNLKTYALAAVIVLIFTACGTSRVKDVGTFLDGSWWNTDEDDCRILMDGNTWTYFVENMPVQKGTWTATATPDADVNGTITFTITHVEMEQGWVDLSVDHKKIKSCTIDYWVNAEGKEITLHNKQLAADDPTGLWSKLEGVYVKDRPVGSKSDSESGGNNFAGLVGKTGDGSASQASKNAPKIIFEERPFIPYVIIGSGSSFAVIRNGYLVITANQTLNDAIDAIRKDSTGSNASIQFGNNIKPLDIGSTSLRFDNWSIIALSGKITSSASPVINVNSSYVASVADISTTNTSAGGSVIDNNGGTLVINGGTVTANTANIYGIKNNGGTVVVSNGNVTPRGEGIHNDSGSGKAGNVLINGGTVHSMESRSISNMKGSTMTVSGGTVSSSSSEAVYNPGGALKISGGTVTGGISGHAIWNTDGGNVTINGGTVSLLNISGSYAAINNDSGGTITITGGTILAPNGGKAISNADDATANITTPPAVIKGQVVKRE